MAVLATLAVLIRPAWAQSAPPHEQVFDLATIQAAHEVCGFPLSDEQINALEQRRQALVDHDGIAPEEITAVSAQLDGALRRQQADGLCKAGGPEAVLYRRKLEEYGLL